MESNLNRVLNQNRHQLSGLLCKYTNVVKDWQYRWFTVDVQLGTLSYYLCDAFSDDGVPHILGNSPRRILYLPAAVVCASDEDSRAFTISCASGDTLKLRAVDARARQEWVDELRAIDKSYTKAMSINSNTRSLRKLPAASTALVVLRQQLQQTELWHMGWQYRWFTVDAQAGTLSYYLCDSSSDDSAPHILGNSPRGQVHLAAAVVCPSDEDSRTFTISCASGDTLKLRAVDARARQEWVDGLRAIAESHTKAMGINSNTLPPRELLAASDALVAARQQLQQTELCNASLARTIESINGAFSPTDPDLLLLKAISTASTQCLHQCLSLLQRHQDIQNNRQETTGAF